MRKATKVVRLNPNCEIGVFRLARIIVCASLASLMWLWPYTQGPVPTFWPDWIAYVCLISLLCLLPRDRAKAVRIIVCAWVGAALLNAVIGIAQYFGLKDGLSPTVYAVHIGVAVGNLRQTNHLATFLSIGLLGVFWLNEMKFLSRRIAIAVALSLLLGIAATASRVGVINLFLVALAFLCFGSRSKGVAIKAIFLFFLAYLIASSLLPELLKLFQGLQGRSIYTRLAESASACHGRLVLWSNVLDLISESPWIGRSDLAFQHYMRNYSELRFCEKLGNSHNLVLQLAVSFGVPVALSTLLVSLYFYIKKNPWISTDFSEKLVWFCVLLILAHSFFEYPLWYGNFQVAFILCLLYLYPRSSCVAFVSLDGSLKNRILIYGARVVILFLLLYASFDYLRISQLYLQPDRRLPIFAGDLLRQANKTFLFKRELIYSQVRASAVTVNSAPHLYLAALDAVRYSPDPEVIEKLIESAIFLRNFDISDFHMQRYKQAYPADFERWSARRRDFISIR